MDTDRVSVKKGIGKSVNSSDQDIIAEYEALSKIQQQQRQELLTRIDHLVQRKENLDSSNPKLDQFTSLLMDIRSQIAGITQKPVSQEKPVEIKTPDESEVIATDSEIQTLSKEVQNRSRKIDEEISSLSHLLEKKKQDIKTKDRNIEELNDRLDLLSEEKSRLAKELDAMTSVIDSWKDQLELLQKLATSDPRYRVIETLKKHGNLSDIQMAFTMGTSINQLRKYIDDLLELQLITKTSNGKYSWTGKDMEPKS